MARGYLGRPSLTAERFTPNPFSDRPGERMYRTGDLARYRYDGNLEYLGRRDQQVKIRGHRIEPGEIEAVLNGHADVQESVVIAREVAGEKQIIAYIVAVEGAESAIDELRAYMRSKLPEYLNPSIIVSLPSLPVTPNGKVDRVALPAVEARITPPAVALLPRDAAETYMARLWMEMLDLETISIRDNFFDLGGNSLRAIAVCARVQETYRTRIPLRAIFEWPTIEQFAGFLRKEHESTLPSTIVPIRTRGTRKPLFCVHPSGALANCYMELAQYLGKDQPFYGLQPRGLMEDETAVANVEEMAAAYIADIQSVQPRGPYQVAGWSMGTVVAFEMARQMAEAGMEISLVALFDGIFPEKFAATSPDPEQHLQQIETEILSKIAELELGMPAAEFCALDREAQFQFCYEGSRAQKGALVLSASLPAYRRYIRTVASNGHAWRTYRPRPYPGRITMFTSGHREDKSMDLWKHAAAGGMDIIELPGRHDDFCYGENARLLADRLRAEIENSGARMSQAVAEPVSRGAARQ